MTTSWSGPGRALTEHLARFRDAAQTHRYVLQHTKDGRVSVHPDDFAATEHRWSWLLFCTTYSRAGLAESMTGTLPDGVTVATLKDGLMTENPTDPLNVRIAMNLMGHEYRMLDEGVTYYVSDRLVSIITEATEQAVPEPLFNTDLPTPHGFAVFEQPWMCPDLHPDTGRVVEDLVVPIRAMGWTTAEVHNADDPDEPNSMGVVIVMYTDQDSYNEVYVPKVSELMGQPATKMDRPLSVLDAVPWRFGNAWTTAPDDASPEELEGDHSVLPRNVAYGRVWALSFFRLLWQELFIAEAWSPDRASRRRWDQIGHPLPEDGGVKIVKLRRVAQPTMHADFDDEHDEHRWRLDHRVIVRGHWRRQWYRSLGPARLEDGTMNPASHRLVWVPPHVRGPEDGPLILKHSITSVTR